MKLKIKSLIYFQIYFVMICRFLTSVLHFPQFIKYVPDVIAVILMMTMFIYDTPQKIRTKQRFTLNCLIFILFTYSICTSIFNAVPLMFVIWAIRVTFRFYIFYIACTKYLKMDDVEKIFSSFEKIFIINGILVLYQFLVAGYEGDYLGGIFGIETGCNGYMNVFFVIMLIYEMNSYYNKKIGATKFAFYIISMLAMAGISELKIFYVETVIAFLGLLLVNKPSKRTVKFLIICVVGLIVGLNVIKNVFPEAYLILFDLDEISKYLSASWSGGSEVARTTAIPFINRKFMNNSIIRELFGLGFGNCEMSSFFETPFAEKFANTNYRNFSFAMQYLETGLIGLILYASFFVVLLIDVIKGKCNEKTQVWKNFLIVYIILIGLNVWYNDTCKSDCAYLIYFCLAIFTIYQKDKCVIEIKKEDYNI